MLRRIPTDATFDQVGKLESIMGEIMAKGYRIPKAFSFDLSAATDRLPVLLQRAVLEPVLGVEGATAWVNLLVDRPYVLPRRAGDALGGLREVYYKVGQPMGALSS